MLHANHPAIIRRLKRADGHLQKIIEMIEQGRPCSQIAQQLQAVESAIENAKKASVHYWDTDIRHSDITGTRGLLAVRCASDGCRRMNGARHGGHGHNLPPVPKQRAAESRLHLVN